jgi:hypothetical protein
VPFPVQLIAIDLRDAGGWDADRKLAVSRDRTWHGSKYQSLAMLVDQGPEVVL